MINTDKNLFLNQTDNVTVVMSEGRGSGKTWLSQTLAHAINLLGKRVLFVAADNGTFGTDFQTNINQNLFLDEVVDSVCTLNQAIRSIRKKFDMVSVKAGSDLLENLPVGRLQLLGDDLCCIARHYDQVFLDVSNSKKVLHNFLPKKSNIILLCNNNPSSLVLAYKFLQEEIKISAPEKIKIVVNYATSYEDGRQTYNTLRKACEQYINYIPELLGIVRNDPNVREAITKHSLFLTDYSSSPAAVDIMNIAEKLQKGEKNAA